MNIYSWVGDARIIRKLEEEAEKKQKRNSTNCC